MEVITNTKIKSFPDSLYPKSFHQALSPPQPLTTKRGSILWICQSIPLIQKPKKRQSSNEYWGIADNFKKTKPTLKKRFVYLNYKKKHDHKRLHIKYYKNP